MTEVMTRRSWRASASGADRRPHGGQGVPEPVLRLGRDVGEHTLFASRLAAGSCKGWSTSTAAARFPSPFPFSRYDLRGPGFE